ncbi:MAG: DUF4290 domain-containing protein [Bacteroidetes bacterium]|nr:DUF4290 domain-containing protein [Bacteroidota bacterium]
MHENYNTKKEPLILKEYGRNVQKLINKISEIKDKAERTKKTELIIRVMKSVNQKVRGISDDSRKIWDDLFIMSDYKLDIDSPFPMPEKDILQKKISRMPYKQDPIKFKHFGRNIELLLKKISKEKELEKQERLAEDAMRIMKGFNFAWNNDSNDLDGIIGDMKLIIGSNTSIDFVKLKNEGLKRTNVRNNRYKSHHQKTTNNKNNSKWTSS